MDLQELALWNFGVLEVSESTFGCLYVFSCVLFFIVYLFDAKNVDLRLLRIERLLCEVWGCLDLQSIKLECLEC